MKNTIDMTSSEYKVYENRIRRTAARRGLALMKSRRRDPQALDYGGYMLYDPTTRTAVYSYGWNGFGPRLEDVERWLEA